MDEVGVVNDAAYGIPPGTIGDALAASPSTRGPRLRHPRRRARRVSVASHPWTSSDDAFVTFVATLPDLPRRAARVARARPRAARGRGSAAGPPRRSRPRSSASRIYARLGYRPLGEIHLYEKRPREPQPRARGSEVLPALRRSPPTSPTRARSAARTAATAPTTTRSRWRRRSPSPPTTRSSCCDAASTPARACGRSPAASSTSASRSRRPRAERRSEEIEIDIELDEPRRRLLARRGARRADRLRGDARTTSPQTTDEALEVHAFAPDEIPWQELAFWSTTNALKDFLARS